MTRTEHRQAAARSRTGEETPEAGNAAPAFGWLTLWFGVLGGAAAWGVHIFVAWSFLEVGCLGRANPDILQQEPGPGAVASLVAYVATGVPWLVALVALLACVRMRLRLRSARADDDARIERTALMVVLGLFLNVMALAAITGSGVGLLVLEPCG